MPLNIIPPAANIGAGAGQVFANEDAYNTLNLKTIKAGAGISVVNNASDIEIINTGATPPTGMYWEETIHFSALYDSGGSVQFSDAWPNPAVDTLSWTMDTNDYASWFHQIHSQYAGGDIQARIYGFDYFGSSSTHTWAIQAYWKIHGDDYNIAYTASTNITTALSGTGSKLIISPWTTFTQDGAWGIDKLLCGKIKRTDSNSDVPNILGIKLKYPIVF